MTIFFYYDANGQKQGPVDEQQLKALATQGTINPQTSLETDIGHRGQAGQIPGLNFNAVMPSPFTQTPPYESAQLVIYRPFAVYAWAVSYNVFVNGQNVGNVANGKNVEVSVPAGFAKIEVKMFGTPRLAEPATINITAGQEKKIIVRVKKYYMLTTFLLVLIAIIPGLIYSLVVPPCVIEEQN